VAVNADRLHAIVSGKVQGVGFRYFVRQQAESLSLVGWVRNLANRNVELVAEGQRADLQSLLTAVRQGPRGSSVSDVETEWGDATGEFNNFSVKPTA
jgi:acylphosphatase